MLRDIKKMGFGWEEGGGAESPVSSSMDVIYYALMHGVD